MTLGLLIIRVIAGLTMAVHGGQKLFGCFGGRGRRGTAGMMDKLGYREPAIMASLAGLAELAGGLGLALGLLTPLAAIAVGISATGPGDASTDNALGFMGALSGDVWAAVVIVVALLASTVTMIAGRHHEQMPGHPVR